MTQMPRLLPWLFVVLLGIAVVILIADLQASMKAAARIEQLASREQGCTCLPLPSLPLQLIHEDPRCAQRIIEMMDVTNVRVVANLSQVAELDPEHEARLRKIGFEPPRNESRSA